MPRAAFGSLPAQSAGPIIAELVRNQCVAQPARLDKAHSLPIWSSMLAESSAAFIKTTRWPAVTSCKTSAEAPGTHGDAGAL